MKIKEVLIVFKKSALERIGSKKAILSKCELENLEKNARMHYDTLEKVKKILGYYDIESHVIKRTKLPCHDRSADSYDLVITIGGDGTLLRGAHFVTTTPVLGVNSAPSNSVGLLCSATADNFQMILDKIVKDKMKPLLLQRVQAFINNEPICPPALNEVLFAHRSPASTSRYIICFNGKEENHKSSGVWIATPSGSTAAVFAAGGKVLPIKSRNLQFVVREPFILHKPLELIEGIIKPRDKLEIISKTIEGALFIDGQPDIYPIPFGLKVRFKVSPYPLPLMGYNLEKRRSITLQSS
mgnify:CR=1 FL=1